MICVQGLHICIIHIIYMSKTTKINCHKIILKAISKHLVQSTSIDFVYQSCMKNYANIKFVDGWMKIIPFNVPMKSLYLH
jgi:hypothetical protein